MKCVVTGSHTLDTHEVRSVVFDTLNNLHDSHHVTLLISGHAASVDLIAESWAEIKGIAVHVSTPDWRQYGRGAGLILNREMIALADYVVAFWDGKSSDTKQMIQLADAKSKLLKAVQMF